MNPVKKTVEALRFSELYRIWETKGPRIASLHLAADYLRQIGPYRWVGLYDVDHASGMVKLVVCSGAGAPEYPTFPITKGLTSAAISTKKTVNVGDVASDPRYLTAFGGTRSEIIIPILDTAGEMVVGTIDIESETPNAFSSETQALLESVAEILRSRWHSVNQPN